MKGAAEHEGRGNQPESAALLRALDAGLSPELLERALTHRSFAYENGGLPTNERLEFLGDAVLGLIVTDALFRGYPDLPEGHLAKLRAAVVNMRALAERGARPALGDYVRLGRGEEGTGGRDKSSILADTLEAVIGAVYIERGLAEAWRARAPAVRPGDRPVGPARGRPGLEDLAAGTDRRRGPRRAGVPRRRERPRPPESFRAAGPGGRARYGSGEGRSKKEAEQQAAAAAWSAISTGGRRAGGRGRAGG